MRGKICLILAAATMMACGAMFGSGEEPKSESVLGDEDPLFAEESAGSAKKSDAPAVPECLDAEGYEIECLKNSDCCPGFYCGYDPEGSQRVKTCLYSG